MRPVSTTSSDELVGRRVGKYELLRALGRGKMGVVYEARDLTLLRRVAIKVLNWTLPTIPEQDPAKYFLAEARNVARINHPRVVQVYAVERRGTRAWIAMELVDGPSVEGLLAKQGHLPLPTALGIIGDVAEALEAAHKAGVVHRDVKPANMLVGSDGTAKLGDFGIALVDDDHHKDRSSFACTPLYAAPEVWRGTRATAQTDIYALGASFFHMIVGRPPFLGDSVDACSRQHLEYPIPDPNQLRPELEIELQPFFKLALAKKARKRFSSAHELREMVLELTKSYHTGLPPMSYLDDKQPSSTPSGGGILNRFDFTLLPFGSLIAGEMPYEGPPYQRLIAVLEDQLSKAPASIALVGPPKSGRSTTIEAVLARLSPPTRIIRISPPSSRLHTSTNLRDGTNNIRTPLISANDVWVGLKSQLSAELATSQELLEQLKHLAESSGRLVIVLDTLNPDAVPALAPLLALPKQTDINVIAVLNSDTRHHLEHTFSVVHEIPKLGADDVKGYIEAWLRFTRKPSALPLLFTPDALNALSQRVNGELARLNIVGLNAIVSSAVRGGPLVTSADVARASEDTVWIKQDGNLRPGCPPAKDGAPSDPNTISSTGDDVTHSKTGD